MALIPGIQNEVTLDIIVPKLSWGDLQRLSSLNPFWQEAIKSRQVHHARVRAHATAALVVIGDFYCPGRNEIEDPVPFGLYSIRDKSWYDLPPVPFPSCILWTSQFIALDGKIYILGVRGLKYCKPMPNDGKDSVDAVGQGEWRRCGATYNEVYVLDVAARGEEWTQCTSMLESRLCFAAGVLNGKIYVVGGCTSSGPVLGCEVYDPKIDAWSPVEPMTEGQVMPTVGVAEEKLFVYRGQFFGQDTTVHATSPTMDSYHPGKGEWTQVEASESFLSSRVFMARGKFHKITGNEIFVYDIEKDSWHSIHSFGSSAPRRLMSPFGVGPDSIIAVGDELVFADSYSLHGENPGRHLYQSKGFSIENYEITWEKVKCSPMNFRSSKPPFMCPIHL